MEKEGYQNLAEKYRAELYKDFVGQEKAVEEAKKFLQDFPKKRGLLIYGPAGTGKTSLAIAIAKENGYEIFELNSSDLRNKAKLEQVLKPASEQRSLFKVGKIILMDEVDGVTGTDIGGIPELMRVLENTKIPVVMTCNDAWQSKLAPVRASSKLIEMKALPINMMNSILHKIGQKENINKETLFYQKIAIKSQGDLRAALNDLQAHAYSDPILVNAEEKRDVEESIFNILRRLFKERRDFLDLFDSSKLSLDEILLWIEENLPREYKNEALIKAYHYLGNADIFRGRIYKKQYWRFLAYQNAFQSAGISYSKDFALNGFTKYEAPKRLLKIWQNNQKSVHKKTIARKYARTVHCSTSQILKEFPLIKLILKSHLIKKQLRLSEEEIAYLEK